MPKRAKHTHPAPNQFLKPPARSLLVAAQPIRTPTSLQGSLRRCRAATAERRSRQRPSGAEAMWPVYAPSKRSASRSLHRDHPPASDRPDAVGHTRDHVIGWSLRRPFRLRPGGRIPAGGRRLPRGGKNLPGGGNAGMGPISGAFCALSLEAGPNEHKHACSLANNNDVHGKCG